MRQRCLLFRVFDAVEAKGFPEKLRHVCVRYAFEANSKTGRNWVGQAVMAAKLGISDRELRRRLDRLDKLAAEGAAPVRIERRRRGAPGGAGRSTDEWRVVVVKENPKRTRASGSGRSEADIRDTRNGHRRAPEEDDVVRGSNEGIQRSDPAVESTESHPHRVLISKDWKPSDSQVEALGELHEITEHQIMAIVPEFVGFWGGKKKTQREWAETFWRRIGDLKERGHFLRTAAPTKSPRYVEGIGEVREGQAASDYIAELMKGPPRARAGGAR